MREPHVVGMQLAEAAAATFSIASTPTRRGESEWAPPGPPSSAAGSQLEGGPDGASLCPRDDARSVVEGPLEDQLSDVIGSGATPK
eukprot:8865322-Pyramimonas_sp.AAC.2